MRFGSIHHASLKHPNLESAQFSNERSNNYIAKFLSQRGGHNRNDDTYSELPQITSS